MSNIKCEIFVFCFFFFCILIIVPFSKTRPLFHARALIYQSHWYSRHFKTFLYVFVFSFSLSFFFFIHFLINCTSRPGYLRLSFFDGLFPYIWFRRSERLKSSRTVVFVFLRIAIMVGSNRSFTSRPSVRSPRILSAYAGSRKIGPNRQKNESENLFKKLDKNKLNISGLEIFLLEFVRFFHPFLYPIAISLVPPFFLFVRFKIDFPINPSLWFAFPPTRFRIALRVSGFGEHFRVIRFGCRAVFLLTIASHHVAVKMCNSCISSFWRVDAKI